MYCADLAGVPVTTVTGAAGRVVTVLHAGGSRMLPGAHLALHGLIHDYLAQHPLQRLQRQSAGSEQSGRLQRSDPQWWTPRPRHRGRRPRMHSIFPPTSSSTCGRRGAAGPPGDIGAGGCDRHAGSFDHEPASPGDPGSAHPPCPSPPVVRVRHDGIPRFKIMVSGPGQNSSASR